MIISIYKSTIYTLQIDAPVTQITYIRNTHIYLGIPKEKSKKEHHLIKELDKSRTVYL